jgi:hypothetical protein
MKYHLIVARAFFTTIAILLTVTFTSATDCTPTGTHLQDDAPDTCPDFESKEVTSLSKTGHWNISWPDGHFDGLSPTGTGQCAVVWGCGVFRQFYYTKCWPLFHGAVPTSDGRFSIFVENRLVN